MSAIPEMLFDRGLIWLLALLVVGLVFAGVIGDLSRENREMETRIVVLEELLARARR